MRRQKLKELGSDWKIQRKKNERKANWTDQVAC